MEAHAYQRPTAIKTTAREGNLEHNNKYTAELDLSKYTHATRWKNGANRGESATATMIKAAGAIIRLILICIKEKQAAATAHHHEDRGRPRLPCELPPSNVCHASAPLLTWS
jgi:pyocin large subunit-like protein